MTSLFNSGKILIGLPKPASSIVPGKLIFCVKKDGGSLNQFSFSPTFKESILKDHLPANDKYFCCPIACMDNNNKIKNNIFLNMVINRLFKIYAKQIFSIALKN